MRYTDGKCTVYSGPWRGKERLGYHGKGELGGIFILQRGENQVIPLSPLSALQDLMAGTLFPDTPQLKLKGYQLWEKILQTCFVAKLTCTPTVAAVETAQKFIEEKR